MVIKHNVIEDEELGFRTLVTLTLKPKQPHYACFMDKNNNNTHDKDNSKQGDGRKVILRNDLPIKGDGESERNSLYLRLSPVRELIFNVHSPGRQADLRMFDNIVLACTSDSSVRNIVF